MHKQNYEQNHEQNHDKKTGESEGHSQKSNLVEEKLFRVIINEDIVKQHKYYSNWLYQQEKEKQPMDLLIKDINTPKDEEVFQIKPFSATMTEYCHLSNKNLIRCPECGEMTEKVTTLEVNGKFICRICGFFEKKI
jgi:formylmethanofuran dehydrogenase subunit E